MNQKFVSILFFSLLLLVSCKAKEAESEEDEFDSYVYIIQDEPKFHKRRCKIVRSNLNLEDIPKSEAEILGYQACFYCRP